MNVAQRRGKGQESLKNQTVLVPEESNYAADDVPNGSAVAAVSKTTTTGISTAAATSQLPATTMNVVAMSNSTTGSSSGGLGGGGNIGGVTVAKVRRNYCGTGPFDHKWLNLDCCGLLCALITYMLHFYALYTVLFILLPPWMNSDLANDNSTGTGLGGTTVINATGTTVAMDNVASARQMMAQTNMEHHQNHQYQHTLSWMGFFHRLVFTGIAVLAITSHWYAMTTDPGSVPPDAQPIMATDDTNDKSGSANHNNNGNATESNASDSARNSSTLNSHPSALQNYLLEPPPSPSRSIATGSTASVKRICRRCKSYKPYRAHHCSICQRCIIKMDHHCPWINNCVGIGNHKYFLLFIFYTSVSCLYSLLLIITRFTACSNSINYHDHHFRSNNHPMKVLRLRHPEQLSLTSHSNVAVPHCLDRPAHLIFILALLVEAILFGLFTGCMMMDQLDVVRSKVTHIDRYKGGDDSVGSHSMAGVLEVFGIRPRIQYHKNTKATAPTKNSSRHVLRDGRFRWDWLSPFVPVCFPSHAIRDEVIGFCRPCFPSPSNFTSKKDTIVAVPLQSSFMKNVATTSSKGSKGLNQSGSSSSMVEII